jgi:hypothetical protein
MKQGKNISGEERRGFKVAKVNLPLSDGRLRLFVEGKEDWLEEGLLVPAEKKNKRGRIIGEGSSTAQGGGAQQIYVPPFGGTPAPLSYYGGVPMQAWGSDATIHPIKFCGAQRSLCRAICTSSSNHNKVATIGGYAASNMQNIAAILTNANQMGEENANIAYEPGCLHLAPLGQSIGGEAQSYYEQGYNNQDYQHQPQAED